MSELDDLLTRAAEMFGVTAGDILSQGKQRPVVAARRVVMWVLRETGMSHSQICEAIGARPGGRLSESLRVVTSRPDLRKAAERLLGAEGRALSNAGLAYDGGWEPDGRGIQRPTHPERRGA